MKKLFVSLSIVAAIVGLWSCNGNREANYKALVAHTWILQEVISADSLAVVLPSEPVEITFSDSSTFAGFAGCNNVFGTFSTYEQDQLTINPVGRTMAFCPDIAFEDQFVNMLPLCTSYTAGADKLELNDTESGTTLLFKAKL